MKDYSRYGKNEIMRKGLTEVVFILDRSGSMGGLEADTLGGFDSIAEASRFGIRKERAVNYEHDQEETANVYASIRTSINR